MSMEEYEHFVNNQRAEWDLIMQESSLLVQLAHQKNWQQLLVLHEKRDLLLRDFFDEALTQELVEKIQTDLEIIKSQDSEIVQLVKNNQSALSDEAKHLNQMKKRIKNYISADRNKL